MALRWPAADKIRCICEPQSRGDGLAAGVMRDLKASSGASLRIVQRSVNEERRTKSEMGFRDNSR